MFNSLSVAGFGGGVANAFSPDSKVLGQSAASARETVKKLDDISSPLQQMVNFFASIDNGIVKLVDFAKRSLVNEEGQNRISAMIAKIMGQDLELEKKQAQLDAQKSRDANIKGEDTDTKAVKEETRSSFLDDLKQSFEDIFNQRTISDLGKILLLASGAFALAKLSDKFQKLLVPVLDFIRNTLIPNLQELNKDILDSPTGYLGIGGAVLAVQAALKGFGKNIRNAFIGKGGVVEKLGAAGRNLKAIFFPEKFFKNFNNFIKKLTDPFRRFGLFVARFAKVVGPKIAQMLKLLPGLGIVSTFAKALGPIGIAIQVIVAAFVGVSRFIESWKEDGDLLKAVGAGLGGVYDAIIGASLNFLADVVGFIFKKIGLKEFGEKIQSLDFSIDGLKKAYNSVIRTVRTKLIELQNKVKSIANSVMEFFGIDKKFEMTELPPLGDVDTVEKIEKKAAETGMTEQEIVAANMRADNKLIAIAEKVKATTGDSPVVTTTTIQDNKPVLVEKNEMLKTVATNRTIMDNKPTVIVQDNKVVKGGDTVSNTSVSHTPINVEHRDNTSRALNFYMFGNAHA